MFCPRLCRGQPIRRAHPAGPPRFFIFFPCSCGRKTRSPSPCGILRPSAVRSRCRSFPDALRDRVIRKPRLRARKQLADIPFNIIPAHLLFRACDARREKSFLRGSTSISEIKCFPATALLTVDTCTPSPSAISAIFKRLKCRTVQKITALREHDLFRRPPQHGLPQVHRLHKPLCSSPPFPKISCCPAVGSIYLIQRHQPPAV